MPYQVFGVSAGALALTIAWSRVAMERSGSGMAAIFASRSLSPASDLSSRTRSFIASRSSSVNPFDFLPAAVVVADFRGFFFGLMETVDIEVE
jgi:hypothetical protein